MDPRWVHQYAGLFSFLLITQYMYTMEDFHVLTHLTMSLSFENEIIEKFPYCKIVFLVFLGLFNMQDFPENDLAMIIGLPG